MELLDAALAELKPLKANAKVNKTVGKRVEGQKWNDNYFPLKLHWISPDDDRWWNVEVPIGCSFQSGFGLQRRKQTIISSTLPY